LPETRTHQSQSGGRHKLFEFDPRARNSSGKIAAGIDVRATGGYVIVPPSPGLLRHQRCATRGLARLAATARHGTPRRT
jgi:hypothetical protein